MPPKFQRNGPYKSNHGPACNLLKQRILLRAEKLRLHAEALKERKKQLKRLMITYSTSGRKKDLNEARELIRTIRIMKRSYRQLEALQITDKKLYTRTYQQHYLTNREGS